MKKVATFLLCLLFMPSCTKDFKFNEEPSIEVTTVSSELSDNEVKTLLDNYSNAFATTKAGNITSPLYSLNKKSILRLLIL